MEIFLPSSLPQLHRKFLFRAIPQLAQETWLVGIAASGSFATDTMDEFSDLDLMLAVEEDAFAAVMKERRAIAESLGTVLSMFAGEHVGEPRLLLCLYGPPLLHVDFVFKALPDAGKRVDKSEVLWEREGRLTAAFGSSAVVASELDRQWMEDRFWVWVHKAAGKIGRGELFEAIEYLAFLRKRILGPICLQKPNGLRWLEAQSPDLMGDLAATVGAHRADECLMALRATVDLYRRLRGDVRVSEGAEQAVLAYLSEIGQDKGV